MNKTVRILTILAVLLSIAQLAAAAIRPGAAVPRAAKGKNLKALDANAWLIKTTNYGPFVFPEGSNSGGFWGGPGYNYIYGAGMWVGALDTLGTAHVSLGYYPNNGGSEFGPVNPYTGEWVNQATDPLARVYLSNNPTDLAEWPLRDSLGQPIVVSVQDGYAAYSDVNPAFTFTG
ncbi:MAG: hypothetical protein MUE63_06910, partial [Xanthomonadales bacterium]|nr:hypothetical protein [Xanthomonadales bacterium]